MDGFNTVAGLCFVPVHLTHLLHELSKEEYTQFLNDLCAYVAEKKLVLVGDFNIPVQDLEDIAKAHKCNLFYLKDLIEIRHSQVILKGRLISFYRVIPTCRARLKKNSRKPSNLTKNNDEETNKGHVLSWILEMLCLKGYSDHLTLLFKFTYKGKTIVMVVGSGLFEITGTPYYCF